MNTKAVMKANVAIGIALVGVVVSAVTAVALAMQGDLRAVVAVMAAAAFSVAIHQTRQRVAAQPELLAQWRLEQRTQWLTKRGVPAEVAAAAAVEIEDKAAARQLVGSY